MWRVCSLAPRRPGEPERARASASLTPRCTGPGPGSGSSGRRGAMHRPASCPSPHEPGLKRPLARIPPERVPLEPAGPGPPEPGLKRPPGRDAQARARPSPHEPGLKRPPGRDAQARARPSPSEPAQERTLAYTRRGFGVGTRSRAWKPEAHALRGEIEESVPRTPLDWTKRHGRRQRYE
jgi:hypothetical protein